MMSAMKGCSVHQIGWVLLVIGGINWGLVGIGGFVGANWNLVNKLLGAWPQVEWVVYILVGVGAIMSLMKDSCSMCKTAK